VPDFILNPTFKIADETNYKELVAAAIASGETLVIRTPIDINLAKEMNILSSDLGLSLSQVLMDTDIGGLGYGLEYGYSMIEKIKLSDDKYSSPPIISYAVDETLKSKEAKLDKNYAYLAQIASAAAVAAAGADVIVMRDKRAKAVMGRVWQS
jgi:acetyl-CoA decarbonylase/synthase complex subunit delta